MTVKDQQKGESVKRVGVEPSELPNVKGAEEVEKKRQSELAGQKRATDEAERDSRADEAQASGSPREPDSGRSDAAQANENERRAEEEGRELPG